MPADDARIQHVGGGEAGVRHGDLWGLAMLCALLCAGVLTTPVAGAASPSRVEVIFQLPLAPSGLTVTPEGGFLLGVSFEQKPQNRVIAVGKGGDSKPFPTIPISQAAPGESLQLDAIQGMQCTDDGIVWMLDNGRRNELSPKVVAWDSGHGRLHRVFHLVAPAVLSTSLLDDLAVDPQSPSVYLADPASGQDAALVVLDTGTGLARRVLQGHPSVVPVAGLDLSIDGLKLQSRRLDGSLADPLGGVNPLALDKKGEWLYFGPLRSRKLYRVRTEHLRDVSLSSDKLAGLVEEYANKPLCAGITIDGKGNIYVSDLVGKAVGIIAAGSKEYRIHVTDPRFLWLDGLCFGADGQLYLYSNVIKARPSALRGSSTAAPTSDTNYLFRVQTPSSGRVGD